ncbi:nucleotide-binding universal stress UspA family protein [Streptomyces olivoverticillatus]|uniref:Nucleotide-binding universal stress UspA family protein n=1 Tax=Streptomyces olivoverticillatus TaxID=66427 RepID=A0A7W7LQ45_9ACTN|nr:nucleotide-binding universal stress UspA family protein [Streptomyces olivoverticillatus]
MTTVDLPVVVGADGSEGSLAAVEWAARQAVRFRLPLRIVHASRWERYEGPDELVPGQVLATAEQRARQRCPDLEVHGVAVPDDAVSALVDQSRQAAALVTGASGRGAVKELLLGSVVLAVAGRSHCPVTVVRGDERNVWGASWPVVVGVGEGGEGIAAVRFALREAAARGCEVQAVRAWRAPQQVVGPLSVLDDTARAFEEQARAVLDEVLGAVQSEYPQVTVRRTVLEGPPHRVLQWPSADAGLLVLGAGGRHGHRGLQLGRVCHTALHRAACPVTVVPHS